MVLAPILATLGGVLTGSFLTKGGSSGGQFGGFNIASPQTNVDTKKQTINAPFNFLQFAPVTSTETITIFGNENVVSTKKELTGSTAQPIQQLSPVQATIPSSSGSSSLFDQITPLIFLGTLGVVAVAIFGGKKKKWVLIA